jgi:hypothetical protein
MPVTSAEFLQQVKVPFSRDAIEVFCGKWGVTEFALFGSVLRDDFRPDSDVDVLVSFHSDARPTLLTLVRMQDELQDLFGRRVDLLERGGMEQSASSVTREAVLSSLKVIYAG